MLSYVKSCSDLKTEFTDWEDYCNGYIQYDEFDKDSDNLMQEVASILNTEESNLFINGDPRGYAIKFNQEFTNENIENMYRDLGGYGIVAPDFREVA